MPFAVPCWQGSVADGGAVDTPTLVDMTDTRQQIAERQRAADHQFRQAEGGREIVDATPLPDQGGEGFPAGHLVGIKPGDILDQRGFQRCGIVTPSMIAQGIGSMSAFSARRSSATTQAAA